jgi:hypothetical protein
MEKRKQGSAGHPQEIRIHRTHLFWGLAVLLILTFWVSIIPLAYQNVASSAGDQRDYLKIALWMAHLGKLTDGNRHLLYSLALLPFASRDIAFFTAAKFVSMGIGGLGLGIIFLVSSRLVGWAGAFLVIALLAFNAEFRHTASFVDVEVLLMPLFFLAWYASIQTLDSSEPAALFWAATAGLLAGLVYLAKGTGVLLLPILFVTLFLLAGFKGFRSWRMWIFLLSFVIIALPLWIYNLVEYGNPIYNVNTTHYMWLDSWEESYVGTADNLPTLSSYIQTHSAAHIGERLWNGLALASPRQWYNAVRLEGMPQTKSAARIAVLIGFLLLGVFFGKAYQAEPERRTPFVFTVVGLFLFALLFAWYHPVSDAARFVMLWTPVMYTAVIWLIQSFIPAAKRPLYETALLVIGFLLLAATLAANAKEVPKLANMAEHDRESGATSLAFMESLLQRTEAGDSFLLGPTHAQVEWLAYDRSPIAIPHTYANWPYLNAVLLRENIEYILLDEEMFSRRRPLLESYWTLHETGLVAENLPPGWRLLKPSAYPCDPCLYAFDRHVFEPAVPQHTSYGPVAALTGYSLDPVTPQQPFTLVTNWQLLNDLAENIHVFVHVVEAGGEMVAQHDGALVVDQEFYPEQHFPAGSAIRLEHPLPALPPGTYNVHVGLYRWENQERIPVTESDAGLTGDYPLLLQLQLDVRANE